MKTVLIIAFFVVVTLFAIFYFFKANDNQLNSNGSDTVNNQSLPYSFKVGYKEDLDSIMTEVAVITIDKNKKLSAEYINKRYKSKLTEAIEDINRNDKVLMDAPPPKGAPKFGVYSKVVEKDDPDFITAVKEMLVHIYGFSIIP